MLRMETHLFEQTGLGLFVVFGMCVLVPLAFIAAIVWIATRAARNRHEERMAAISRGVPSPEATPPWPARPAVVRRRDPARGIGWAVGLLVCGVLWAFGVQHFASILVGAGVGFLVRGVVGLKRDAARPDSTVPPPGDSP
jgi:4-hydroxybenzoate polyprenyltransferase